MRTENPGVGGSIPSLPTSFFWCSVFVVTFLLASGEAAADLLIPPGFTAEVYVTGEGFDSSAARGVRGIPAMATLAFDHAGILYLGRTGRRYAGGEVEDLWPIYRIPLGGARLTPDNEIRFLHGPPLPNPHVAAILGGREVFVTTFDRDRKVGVLYRMLDGRAEFLAGGTPPHGVPPLFKQPEGAAVDAAGNLYVADRDQGVIIRLDPSGRVLDPRYVSVTRPRVLVVGDRDELWVGSDAGAAPGRSTRWCASWDHSTNSLASTGRALTEQLGGDIFIDQQQNEHKVLDSPRTAA